METQHSELRAGTGEADGQKHKIGKEEMETRWDSLHHTQPAMTFT